MLDIKLILENPEAIAAKLAKKGCNVDFAPLLELNKKRKELLVSVENAKAERNRLSASVPQVKKEGGDVNAIFAKVKAIAAQSAADEAELAKVEDQIKEFLIPLPNLPDEDLMMVTNGGVVIRIPLEQVKVAHRVTQGVKVIRLEDDKQRVSSITVVPHEDDDVVDEVVEEVASEEPATENE